MKILFKNLKSWFFSIFFLIFGILLLIVGHHYFSIHPVGWILLWSAYDLTLASLGRIIFLILFCYTRFKKKFVKFDDIDVFMVYGLVLQLIFGLIYIFFNPIREELVFGFTFFFFALFFLIAWLIIFFILKKKEC